MIRRGSKGEVTREGEGVASPASPAPRVGSALPRASLSSILLTRKIWHFADVGRVCVLESGEQV